MTDRESIVQLIQEEKLIAIFRKVPVEKAGRAAQALVRGGVRLLEVTFDQQSADPAKDYAETIEAIRGAVGDRLCLGAGTVLTGAQTAAAHAAGARYIISPNTDEEVISMTRQLGMVSIPGAMTPTEIARAYKLGGDIIKLFPADDLGYHYIWNLRGPLPHIPLLATGGVDPSTIPEFFRAGVSGVGTGISIIRRDLLERDDYAAIEALAREHVTAIRRVSQ